MVEIDSEVGVDVAGAAGNPVFDDCDTLGGMQDERRTTEITIVTIASTEKCFLIIYAPFSSLSRHIAST